MKTIDQRKRVQLAQRIMDGDRVAVEELANLYTESGLTGFAKMVSTQLLHLVQIHARQILEIGR